MRAVLLISIGLGCAPSTNAPKHIVPDDGAATAAQADTADTAPREDTGEPLTDTGLPPTEGTYESAEACKSCHERQYEEWSQSMHRYGAVSPVFDAMTAKATRDTSGEVGTFCTGCHSPIGFSEGEDGTVTAADRSETSKEGVSCDVCHTAVHLDGPTGNANIIHDHSGVKYGPFGSSRTKGHSSEAGSFLSSPELCGSCHDVFAYPGIQIEEAYTEYQSSPAKEAGVRCQDCHMSRTPGAVAEPEMGPIVSLEGDYPDRPLSSHRFVGPDYSMLDDFPYPDDLERSAEAQAEYLTQVQTLLSNAARLWIVDCIRVPGTDEVVVQVALESLTSGHNVPTGFTSERQLWVEVTAQSADGEVVYQTGDLDSYGDLRDGHSWAVRSGEISLDADLVNLQSKNLMVELDFDDRGLPFYADEPEENYSIFPFEAQTILKNSLSPGEVRYLRGMSFRTSAETSISARLRYRNLPPYVLRDLGLSSLVERLKIFDISADSCEVASE